MPIWLVAAAAGYLYGTFSGSDGITTRKVVLGSLGASGVYYLVRKAGK